MGSIPLRFFRPVFEERHRRKMELPTAFVEEFGDGWLNTAYLSVSTSDVSWPVKLVRDEKGKIWMKKGWKAFLKHLSVPRGSFLVFEYQGKSKFNVIIMSPSATEINYAPAPVDTPKATELTSNESDVSYGVMGTVPSCSNKRKGTNHEDQGAKAAGKKPRWSLQEEARRRAEAYTCKNPSFMVIMTKPCVAAGRMYIPTCFASRYLSGRKGNTIILQGLDGKTSWSGRYWTGSYTILTTGWRDFATDNRLCVGDVCVFELINVEENIYKVAIFRAYDQDDNGCGPSVKRSTANNQPEKAVRASRGRKPSLASKLFTVKICLSYLQGIYMYIPPQHSVTYLKNHHGKLATLVTDDGKKWPVNVFISGSIGRFTFGWKKFVEDNNLRRGDSCTFELISGEPIRYRVAISRA